MAIEALVAGLILLAGFSLGVATGIGFAIGFAVGSRRARRME